MSNKNLFSVSQLKNPIGCPQLGHTLAEGDTLWLHLPQVRSLGFLADEFVAFLATLRLVDEFVAFLAVLTFFFLAALRFVDELIVFFTGFLATVFFTGFLALLLLIGFFILKIPDCVFVYR